MKSKIIEKKQLLTFSLVSAFCLAIFVNWYYTNQYNETTEPEVSEKHNLGEAQLVNSISVEENNDNYFTQAKINRTKSHDKSIKYLEDIISNSASDKETIELARKQLINISEQIKIETDIENLIKAQLNNDCIVTFDIDSIEVIMPKKTVNEESVVKIKDIILSKSSLSSDQIVIIELK